MDQFQVNKAGLRLLWIHRCGVLVDQEVVLDDDQDVAGLFQDGRELKYSKNSAGLKVLELAVQSFSEI